MKGKVTAVARDGVHRFSKPQCEEIRIVAGWGIEGDAHCGVTVQHRSRFAKTPGAPNLRQVHLIQSELFAELAARGFDVRPGELGENVTTSGIDLLTLSRGTRLRLGRNALVEITGLRNPCRQIDDNVGPGAMAATIERAPDGSLVRKAGVMALALESGTVRPGDLIEVEFIPGETNPLRPV